MNKTRARKKLRENRTRTGGTKVTKARSGAERIAAVRAIVDACQYAKVDGVMVDLFSASAIVSVYDALSEANREKYASLSVGRMATVAFALAKGATR